MSLLNTILSFLPIVVLLVCLLAFKLSAIKSALIGFLIAVIGSLIIFEPGLLGLGIIISKGVGLAISVILIIWGAMFLYNLVNETGALKVINGNIEKAIDHKFCQFLMLSWIFSAFLQGIAGFGVPVIIVTPILISMGFNPITSAAAVLVGHSWAISFGSMGSSISAIDLVTESNPDQIVLFMAIFGTIGMIVMGMSVAWIYGGVKQIAKGAIYIIIPSMVMGSTLCALALLRMNSIIGLTTGLMGLLAIFATYKIKNKSSKFAAYSSNLNIFEAFSPYLFIIVLSVSFFILDPQWKISLDFSGYTSGTGVEIATEDGYVNFNILKYPFSIMMMSSFLSALIYRKKGALDRAKFKKIISLTVKKCKPTTITLLLLLSMAQTMMDSGMINNIAIALVTVAGNAYPLISPVIGGIGTFVTGSNTNSNVLFGNLQETAALELGLQAAVICAVQSIGASITGGIGPTTVALGATAAGRIGDESQIYKLTLAPTLIGIVILGISNYAFTNWIF